VTVPPGNQVSETPAGQAGSALSGPPGNGAPGANAGNSGAGPASSQGSVSSSEVAEAARDADAAMPDSPAAAKPQAPVRAVAAAAAPLSAPAPAETPLTPSAILKATIEATRIVHPSNGVFDVVVQSSGPEGFPESAGVLSSKPVYSVYLRVGAKRDWILQYCLPASDAPAPQVFGSVVRLGATARLNAPFPITTFRPPARQHPGRYLMLHGFITGEGRFEGLRPLGAHDAADLAAASAALERWTFRPATQEGRPVRVEMLLAIPSE
ncbi:MAG TPA: hypothetical protein VN428_08355, partial [Bryobacteraceae bacterium]|nr:hypothetical protein [Bryobacteraceae bacterium]